MGQAELLTDYTEYSDASNSDASARFHSREELGFGEAEDINRFRGADGFSGRAFVPDLLGISSQNEVVRRPLPPTVVQVRRSVSTTGKVVEWEGIVEEVRADEFTCRLRVVKGSDVDFDEFSEFSLDRVSDGDRDLVEPGAIFRLVVGVQAIAGTRQNFSNLIFRRLPAWKQKSVEQSQEALLDLLSEINWADE